MIDVLYVAFNRIEFTKETFTALLANTDWSLVRALYVHDDGSTDGTAEWLSETCADLLSPDLVIFHGDHLGGPVATMNWFLDQKRPAKVDLWAKVDNDFIVCAGWLGELDRVLADHPEVDILGLEPMKGNPTPAPYPERTCEEARFIGGKGLMRFSAFRKARPKPGGTNGYFGFTAFQENHPDIEKAWLTPDLPCFGLDQLPFEPWRSMADEHERMTWARRWGEYDVSATDYWSWWTPVYVRAVPLEEGRP